MALNDALDLTALAAAAHGWSIEVVDMVASTNALASTQANAGAEHGTVWATEHQSAGRGRLDRVWTAPPRSGLAFSIVLRPIDLPITRWTWLPLLTGLAVATTLRSKGLDAAVKWPNDVLIRRAADHPSGVAEAKICGILVERIETPTGPAAIVGIGVNTSLTAEELPVPTATSVMLETGAPVDRSQLLGDLLNTFFDLYDSWLEDPAEVAEAYVAASATLGRVVRAELPHGAEAVGAAVGIDPIGCLVIETSEGEISVSAGDVVHLRPA